MSLTVAGVSHWNAPIEIREKVAVSPAEVPEVVHALRERAGVQEAVLLSTCNRTELYMVEGDADALPGAWAMMSDRLGAPIVQYGYVRRDRDVVTHLYRVAAGLDSMILGEAQITGQVRDAWTASRPESGAVLNRLFQSALQVAHRVRTETAVGRGAASVSSAAVQLAKKIFGSLNGRRAMVLGAGEMAELALECFVSEGVRAAIVANRSRDRALELAAKHGAEAISLEDFWRRLHEVDVLLSSTAAPATIVRARDVRPSLAARGDRPLCVLDIALPRDVDPEVGELSNVFLYDLDDVRAAAAANIERRRQELPSAEELIEREVEMYWTWLSGLGVVPVLTAFRAQMDRLREQEMAHAMRRLSHLSPDDRQAIEHFSRALMNKFLHEPTVRLRAAATNGRGIGIVDAVRYLFGLPDAPPHLDEPQSPAAEARPLGQPEAKAGGKR